MEREKVEHTEMRLRLLESKSVDMTTLINQLIEVSNANSKNVLAVSYGFNALAESVEQIHFKMIELKNMVLKIESYIQQLNEKVLTLEKVVVNDK